MFSSNAVINGKIPKLRFLEFEHKWEKKKLGEICDKPMYGMNAASKSYDGSNIYLRITDIDETNGSLRSNNLTSPDGDLEDIYKLKDGDLLFARTGASVGKTYLYKKEDGNLYFAGYLIKFAIKKALPYFIYLITLQSNYLKWVKTVSMRSGQPGINAKEYESFEFYLPSFPEQQKIADFLESVDKWIENLQKQKEKLEEYKKGMMQKIFSQSIRFKDGNGNDFPEWHEKKFGEIIKIGSGKDFKHLGAGNIPVFGTGGYMTSVNKSLYSGESVFIGRKGTIDKPFYYNGDFWTVDTLFYTYDFNGVIPKFLYLTFFQINWKKHNEASGVPSLSKTIIEKLKVSLPSLAEQERIVQFIFAIDALIKLKQMEIEKATIWKKGLMQQLFI